MNPKNKGRQFFDKYHFEPEGDWRAVEGNSVLWIQKKSPLLEQELLKLPEIQDGISEPESEALEKLVDIYNENPETFDKVFEQMYQVGIPEIRKYCSPLQALFWIAKSGELGRDKNPLHNYSLSKLIGNAWLFEETILLLNKS